MYKKIIPLMLLWAIVLAAVYVTVNRSGSGEASPPDPQASPAVQEYKEYPPSYPTELIVEPAAMEQARRTLYASGSEKIVLEYRSFNAPGKTVELYRRVLQSRQWNTEEVVSESGSLVMKVSRESAEASFTFTAQDAASTKVEVSYEKFQATK